MAKRKPNKKKVAKKKVEILEPTELEQAEGELNELRRLEDELQAKNVTDIQQLQILQGQLIERVKQLGGEAG